MKKNTILLLLFILSFVLFGCNPPDDIIINDRVEQFENGATEVSMWVNDFEEWNNQLAIEQRMDFNDQLTDGIQLKQTFVEVTAFDDQMRAARETGNEPDIYMISYGNLYRDVSNGVVADITNYFDQAIWDDLYDSAENGVKYNNKYYGFPILLEPSTVLFYRKDLLQQYGGTSSIPTNWADFLTLSRTIKSNIQSSGTAGLYPLDIPKGVALGWGSWGIQMAATGGLAITEDWSTARATNPGYEDIAELWYDLYNEGLVPLSSGDYTEIINDLAVGKLVMTTAGSWSIATIINDYPDLIDQIGVAIMPTFDGNQDRATATNGGWVYVISESSTHKTEAAAVIDFLVGGTNNEETLDYFRGAKYSKTSSRVSIQNTLVAELSSQTEIPASWIETITYISERAIMEPNYPWDLSVTISGMLENVALG